MMGAILWPGVTILAYWLVKRLYIRYPRVYLTPLLVAPFAVAGVILLARVPYAEYHDGAKWLSNLITPATICLAVPLYKNRMVLKRYAGAVLTSVIVGAVLGIVSSVWMGLGLGLGKELIGSLAPHSATTPIAMAASELMEGDATVAAVLVLVTGVLGMVAGPLVIRMFRIRSDISKGVLLGTGAHAAGTSKALELGAMIGAVSSIAMILTGLLTIGLAPWLLKVLM